MCFFHVYICLFAEHPGVKSKEQIAEKLSYIANHTAVHSVSNLGSMDNVTVMIVLLQGGEPHRGDDPEEEEDAEVLMHTGGGLDSYSAVQSTGLTAAAAPAAATTIYYGNRAAVTPSPVLSGATNGLSSSPVTIIGMRTISFSAVSLCLQQHFLSYFASDDSAEVSSVPTTVIFKKHSAASLASASGEEGVNTSPTATKGIAYGDEPALTVPLVEKIFHPISTKSAAVGGSLLSAKAVTTTSSGSGSKKAVAVEEEDDLMDFLKDDSNF